ncbi:LamG domain-containing protein [Streptomyces sp. YC504]|uniref:LamG domain-containing protein n=2 Tax=Streptomyces mesophilus TaxID=1775132 RepID=A0A6G4XPP0_9ACTN|nr:LamG domain-containing protein [Streptomyces mesophilus]
MDKRADSSVAAAEPPRIELGSPYTPCLANDCVARGGPGQKATFTFSPGTADADVVGYSYKVSGQDAWSRADGRTATVDFVPPTGGSYTVWVSSVDSRGVRGVEGSLHFQVAAGEGPVGRWHFGEGSGVAVDAAGADGQDDATLHGGAVRDDRGRRGLITRDATGGSLEEPVTDKGLSLDGTSGFAQTDGPVLSTRSSYTVAAWVRVDPEADGTVTALSQSATGSRSAEKSGPFSLSYDAAGDGRWSMRVVSDDRATHEVTSPRPSPRGVWTHVAGVHDASTQQVSLYVNGVLSGTTAVGAGWDANGPLQFGRALHAGEYTDYLRGSIDEPVVWGRALTTAEVRNEARTMVNATYAAVELVADFSAARANGTSIEDTTSGYGKSLSLEGGASVGEGRIVLDGVDDAATAAGPLVDDTGSFTVTTRVELDEQALLTKDVGFIGQILGQRSADGSAWGLWFEYVGKETVLDEETMEEIQVPVGLWRFGRLNTDGTFSSVTSEQVVRLDGAARLTGVHDSVDATIGLYVGSAEQYAPKAFAAEAGSGDFAVGKAFAGGEWKHFLPARITEMRLWSGAMASPDQISNLVGD